MATMTDYEKKLVPPAVLRQMEEAEAAFASHAQGEQVPAENTVEPAPAVPETPDETPAAQDAPVVAAPEATPSATPAPAPAAPAPNADIMAELERMKQAHAVLEGKYRAEVPRLAAELREKKSLIDQLQEQLKAKQSLEATTTTVMPTRDPMAGIDITEDEKLVAPEVISLTDKIANARVAAVQRQLDEIREQAQRRELESFYGELDSKVPDWRIIDVSPEFQDWLTMNEPHQRLLGFAGQSRNVACASQVYETYKNSIAPPQQPAAAPVASAPEISLEAQVVPKPSVSAPTPKPEKKMYTLADLDKFAADISKGRITGARAAEIQKELDLAVREGRISH